MEALSPDSSWTPQDDLMLINAVMTGASLELLLGRFNDQELQARWRTLLYSLGEKETNMQNTLVPYSCDTSGYGIETIVNSSSSVMYQNSRDANNEFPGHDETIDVSSFLLDTPCESETSDKDAYERLPVPDVDVAHPKESSNKYIDPEGVIPCTLNTEVPEVPHNNNAFLLR